jgi:hypothetical protein
MVSTTHKKKNIKMMWISGGQNAYIITFTLGCFPLGKCMVYVRGTNVALFSAPPRAKYILQYSSAVKLILRTIWKLSQFHWHLFYKGVFFALL